LLTSSECTPTESGWLSASALSVTAVLMGLLMDMPVLESVHWRSVRPASAGAARREGGAGGRARGWRRLGTRGRPGGSRDQKSRGGTGGGWSGPGGWRGSGAGGSRRRPLRPGPRRRRRRGGRALQPRRARARVWACGAPAPLFRAPLTRQDEQGHEGERGGGGLHLGRRIASVPHCGRGEERRQQRPAAARAAAGGVSGAARDGPQRP
jgi:hypothetical protein